MPHAFIYHVTHVQRRKRPRRDPDTLMREIVAHVAALAEIVAELEQLTGALYWSLQREKKRQR